jgi:hypothetical protein
LNILNNVDLRSFSLTSPLAVHLEEEFLLEDAKNLRRAAKTRFGHQGVLPGHYARPKLSTGMLVK